MGNFIDPKYREKAKTTAPDWVSDFIYDHCYEGEGKKTLNVDLLLDLGNANALKVEHFREQKDRKNAPGRIRMSIGGMLRAAAKRRHGLNDIDGYFVAAPADFIGENPKTENPDGSKIAKKAAPSDKAAATPAKAAA